MLSYRLFRTIVLVILIAISFTSCLEGPVGPQGPPGEYVSAEKDTIVGIWEKYAGSERLILRENGTCYGTYSTTYEDYSGTYSVDGNILSLRHHETQDDYEYLLSGNRLSLKRKDSNHYTDFIRVSY